MLLYERNTTAGKVLLLYMSSWSLFLACYVHGLFPSLTFFPVLFLGLLSFLRAFFCLFLAFIFLCLLSCFLLFCLSFCSLSCLFICLFIYLFTYFFCLFIYLLTFLFTCFLICFLAFLSLSSFGEFLVFLPYFLIFLSFFCFLYFFLPSFRPFLTVCLMTVLPDARWRKVRDRTSQFGVRILGLGEMACFSRSWRSRGKPVSPLHSISLRERERQTDRLAVAKTEGQTEKDGAKFGRTWPE